ncbi:unnamed protein product [Rotaria magnacalcarata]
MSNSLAKKFDKIVSKLGSKAKETTEQHANKDDITAEGNGENQHESILQRMKGHLGQSHGSFKREHNYQTQGAPPIQIIIDDLKDSPFKDLNVSIAICHIF